MKAALPSAAPDEQQVRTSPGRKEEVRRHVTPEPVVEQVRVARRQKSPALAARHIGGPAEGPQHIRVQRRPRALPHHTNDL